MDEIREKIGIKLIRYRKLLLYMGLFGTTIFFVFFLLAYFSETREILIAHLRSISIIRFIMIPLFFAIIPSLRLYQILDSFNEIILCLDSMIYKFHYNIHVGSLFLWIFTNKLECQLENRQIFYFERYPKNLIGSASNRPYLIYTPIKSLPLHATLEQYDIFGIRKIPSGLIDHNINKYVSMNEDLEIKTLKHLGIMSKKNNYYLIAYLLDGDLVKHKNDILETINLLTRLKDEIGMDVV